MTKSELIKRLNDFSDDDVVIIGDRETGWSNIDSIKQTGCSISIMPDYSLPFSSDN